MKSLIVIFCILLSYSVFSKRLSINLNNAKGRIQVPESWRAEENFMGMRYVYLGPTVKKRRAIVSITTGGIPFSIKEFNKRFNELQKDLIDSKHKWISKRGGKINKVLKTKHGIKSSYLLQDHLVQEESRYISCNNSIVHIKMLLSGDANESYDEAVNVLRSFKCIK